jgi:DNA repair exonuclease SbcCD ATPase subunit
MRTAAESADIQVMDTERRMAEQLVKVRTELEAQTRVELDTMGRKNDELRKELAELKKNSTSAMSMSRKAAEQAVGEVASGAAATAASLRAQLEEARQTADIERAEATRQSRTRELQARAEQERLRNELTDAQQATEDARNQIETLHRRVDVAENDLELAHNEAAIAATRAEHAAAQFAQALRDRDLELAKLRAQLQAKEHVDGVRSDAVDELVAAREVLLQRTEEAEAQLAEERKLWEQTVADLEQKHARQQTIIEATESRAQDREQEADASRQMLLERVAKLETSMEERDAEILRLRISSNRHQVTFQRSNTLISPKLVLVDHLCLNDNYSALLLFVRNV